MPTFVLLTLLLAAGTAPAASDTASLEEIDQSPSRCPEDGDVVAVFTRKREIWLCSRGEPLARIQVALGRGGKGKKKAGDHRTPLGAYALGEPRKSGKYGLFIPIEYPTPEQAARGHSGAAVGIHGPPRGVTEPDFPTTAVDWTLGCVATGSDADVETVAEFVRQRRPIVVVQ